MIEKIILHNVATFRNPIEIVPQKLNFFYGSNGSGKTTISNILGNYIVSDKCLVEKTKNEDSKILVYNKRFVEDNFKESVKGIFTLGEDIIFAQNRLKELKTLNDEKVVLIETKEKTKAQFLEETSKQESIVLEKCWRVKNEIADMFSEAFPGIRGTKQKFADACLSAYEKWNKSSISSLEQIKNRYNIAYSKESKTYPLLYLFEIEEAVNCEESELLQKIITGSTDTPVGQFIDFLGNSDWVKQGINYSDKAENKCPYCQQEITQGIKNEIKSYFDETYEKDCRELKVFYTNYRNYFLNVLDRLQQILQAEVFLDGYQSFDVEYEQLDSLIKLNLEQLEKKVNSPSLKISIKSTKDILENINTTIKTNNRVIEENNKIVNNLSGERKNCQVMLWNYISSILATDIDDYLKFKNGKIKAINSIEDQVTGLRNEIADNKIQISIIEESLTSVAPTVTEINNLLLKFDFKGFHLEENQEEKGTYLILREDGSNAKSTLSEGEYNFITFLYFYHLVYGSQERTGITKNKIVVIDDPISSLDSTVLFIVSTPVKKLINDCRKEKEGIMQVFVLTHNIYFHKEITFLGNRDSYKKNEVLFGIVRKNNNITKLSFFDKNPISSSYELMWDELSNENTSTVTSFNTMRRILEYYFKIIGGVNYEECIDQFEGEDKVVCKALISCINDGSHFISDDFLISFDVDSIDKYKSIFKLIFEKLGHIQHYNMMMKIEN